MASLHEYFVKEGSRDLTLHRSWQIKGRDGFELEIIARLHFDFHANAKYVSFYIPYSDELECPEAILLNQLNDVLSWVNETQVSMGFGDEHMDGRKLVFTGRVYFIRGVRCPSLSRND